MMPSEVEKPMPNSRFPVGRSTTLTLMSTWSAHLAADHLVPRRGIAADVDAPDVDPAARVHVQRKCHLTLLTVGLGHGVDVGERVAFVALPVIPHLKMTRRGLLDVDRFCFSD